MPYNKDEIKTFLEGAASLSELRRMARNELPPTDEFIEKLAIKTSVGSNVSNVYTKGKKGKERFYRNDGSPITARAMPMQSSDVQYRGFRILQPLDVKQGIVAPGFREEGMGIQYRSQDNVETLLKNKFIEEVFSNDGNRIKKDP